MTYRPIWREPVRLSAAAFLTVHMSITTLAAPAPVRGHASPLSIKNPARQGVHPAAHVAGDRLHRQHRQHQRLRSAAMRLAHRQAAHELREAGLRRRSTGHCTSKRRPTCTSLTGVRVGTVEQAIRLKRRSGCPMVITGGTEKGHAPGPYSHARGYKLDIAHNRCLDSYIRHHYRRAGVRGDGARLYRSDGPRAHADIFAREWNHWDIVFR
jgi:hypothetical protein